MLAGTCLNALVAGGRCAGSQRGAPPPRRRCRLNALVAGGRCAGRRRPCHRQGDADVSMPLLRAGDVRAYVTAEGLIATAKCLNALVAGGRCAGNGQYQMLAIGGSCLNALVAGGRCAGPSVNAVGGVFAGWNRLNALVAGGRCAGLVLQQGMEYLPGKVVSMPLLRAGDVRGEGLASGSNHGVPLSQCPCCGRAMCGGHEAADGTAMPQGNRVSMPLLRAGDVRGRPPRSSRGPASAVSMPLLRAGDVRARKGHTGVHLQRRWSQCPCCGRAMCGWS